MRIKKSYDLSSQSKSRSHFKVCWRFLTALMKKTFFGVFCCYFFQFLFPQCLAARAKTSLSRAQNIFMPANINSIVILTVGLVSQHSSVINTEGHSRTNTLFGESRRWGIIFTSIAVWSWVLEHITKRTFQGWHHCSCWRYFNNCVRKPESFSTRW